MLKAETTNTTCHALAVSALSDLSPEAFRSPLDESSVYLKAARQSRLCARACPEAAAHYKGNAKFWLGLAHAAREIEGRRLP
jgi:hypothetical protein